MRLYCTKRRSVRSRRWHAIRGSPLGPFCFAEMMAESPGVGKTGTPLLAHIVHGTDREPQLEPGSETP